MTPTIQQNSITFEKRSYSFFSNVKRGDIGTFFHPEINRYLCKRVVGLPGDTVSFCDGDVYINDTLLEEEYCLTPHSTYCNQVFHVPQDSVFCLGDNRVNSNDSRLWNNPYIPIESIESKVMFSYRVPKVLIPVYQKRLLK